MRHAPCALGRVHAPFGPRPCATLHAPCAMRQSTCAESGLRRLNHSESRYNGAVCKLGKLSSRHRAHRTEAFRRNVLQMQLPPHGRDESLFHFCITQCGVVIQSRYHGVVCELGKLSSRHRAHRAEAFRRNVLQMQLPPHGRDESLFHFCITQCGAIIPDSACV